MPIAIDDFLRPISPDRPAGVDLRYAPITVQIKEARRQEDDVAQGVWKHQVKTADYSEVLKLSRQVLTKQSKDLQIAAWLTEALLAREGFRGLSQGLELIQRFLTDYWESVHPEKEEDGDLEMRATPLRWVGFQLDTAIKNVPIVAEGWGWFKYKESRAVPTEDEGNGNSEKGRLRQELIADGRLTPEDFDRAFNETPVSFYSQLFADCGRLFTQVGELATLCDERFDDASPDFGPLRRSLEEVAQTIRVLYIKKGGNPDQAAAVAPEAEEEVAPAVQFQETTPPASAPEIAPAYAPAPPSQEPRRAVSLTIEPTDSADAINRIIAASHFLRKENPGHPAPFMILRALRWGELQAFGSESNPALADAPASTARAELKRLTSEMEWSTVIEIGENAQAQNSGRAWLDLQRYVVRACRAMGYEAAANTVVSGLRAFLNDYPQILDWTLTDDTPVANSETREWLAEEVLLAREDSYQPPPPSPPPMAPVQVYEPRESDEGPSTFDLAMEAANNGRIEEAFSMLHEEIRGARSGRDRFIRKTQLVQVSLATGNTNIALSLLRDLAAEIERRNLEDWEDPDLIAAPLQMLIRCMSQFDMEGAEKQELYARLCRIHPARALSV